MIWDYKYNGIEEYLDTLQEKGRNLVVIIDPHIKIDKSYFIYSDAILNGIKYFI